MMSEKFLTKNPPSILHVIKKSIRIQSVSIKSVMRRERTFKNMKDKGEESRGRLKEKVT